MISPILQSKSFSKTCTGRWLFGFNGKEKDDEVFGATGTFQDYGFRMYDTRICRFISVDPLASKYPMLTPFQFASNNPILMIDIDGLEGGVTSPPNAPDAVISNIPENTNYEVSTRFKYSSTPNNPTAPNTNTETKAEIKDPETDPLTAGVKAMGNLMQKMTLVTNDKITTNSLDGVKIEKSYSLNFETQEAKDLFNSYQNAYDKKKETALSVISKPAQLPANATEDEKKANEFAWKTYNFKCSVAVAKLGLSPEKVAVNFILSHPESYTTTTTVKEIPTFYATPNGQ